MGVTFEVFQMSGTFDWDNESLKIVVSAGEMDSAVARSMWLEIPSGPVGVCSLWLASRLWTLSCEQDTDVREGPL